MENIREEIIAQQVCKSATLEGTDRKYQVVNYIYSLLSKLSSKDTLYKLAVLLVIISFTMITGVLCAKIYSLYKKFINSVKITHTSERYTYYIKWSDKTSNEIPDKEQTPEKKHHNNEYPKPIPQTPMRHSP
ncbi:hypothetical protein NEAUS03_1752 [Nematocida ausubeli]|nr:hypothetical protein NEAUS03_1752 [Nematocida ausubeli]